MKKHHSTRNRLISLLLCAAILIGLIPLGMVAADERYNGVIADKDKGYGPGTIHAIPSGITDEAFEKAYVTNGGKLSLNSKFRLVDSSNYNGSKNSLPSGTMEGKKNKKWWASYKLNLTDEELEFINSGKCSVWFQTNMISDNHSHGLFSKKWHWSTSAFALSGPNADGSNSWVYGTNGRNGDPGYVRYFNDISSEKNDGQPQFTSKYMGSIPYDGNLYFNAYQLWNRDCGNARLSGTVFYASIGGSPWVKSATIVNEDGANVSTKSSITGTKTLYLKLDMSTKFRFADNKPHDLSGMKIYLDAQYLEQSPYSGGFTIPATFDHMTQTALYFEVKVKEEWKHFKITGVSGDKCGINQETDLVVWDANGKPLDAVKLTSETLFSDVYGSPMGTFEGTKFPGRQEYLFDCVGPELTKLDMSGNGIPTNASAPEDWNSNSGNKSDVFAGTDGDTYSFCAEFSENITVENQGNARAVLSITQNGEPIKLKITNVSGKSVTFEDITVTGDMLAPGEQIYIERFENFAVLDQVGNRLNITSVMKPAQQVLLDVDSPYTDTTHIPDSDEIYTAYADSAVAGRFSFPVKFQDVTASGVQNSGIAGTDMTFKLEMADGTLDLPYHWYMDTKQTISSDAVWQPGVMGGEITYTDLAENQLYWIHIELDKGTDYHYTVETVNGEEGIWFNGKLTFDGLRDWAGNTGTSQSYFLRHQVDREAPDAEFASRVSMQYSFLDNSDVALSFDVKFRGIDNYAMDSLYYQWEVADENGRFTPVGNGFTKIDVSKDTLNREESGSSSYEMTVDSENRGKARVKVYAMDRLGNTSEVITSEPVSWLFGGIRNNSTVKVNDIFTPTKLPAFDMNAPTTEGSTGTTPAALLVIPDVNSRNAAGVYTQFWIWGTKSLYDDYSVLSEYIEWYERGYNFSLGGYLGKVTGSIDVENAEGIFTDMLQLNIRNDEQTEELLAARKELYDYLTTYNGSMELYTVATYSIADEFEDVQFYSAQSTLNTYEVYLLNEIEYQLDWTIVNAEGKTDAQSAAAGGVKLDYESGQGAYPATNLDNVSVTVKITNIADANNKNGVKYGLDFLNYAEGNAAFELYYTDRSHYNQNNVYDDICRYTDRIPIKTWDLVKSADGTNTVVFEPGLCKDNGYYTLAFVYKDNYTGVTQKLILGAFYMDATTLDISITDYWKAMALDRDQNDSDEKGFYWTLDNIEEKYANDEQIRIGLAPTPEGWFYGDVYDPVDRIWVDGGSELSFRSTRRPDGDNAHHITDDLAAIRVYNVTYNAQAGMEKDASGGWISTIDSPGGRIQHVYVPYLADVKAQTPYEVVDSNQMLPFVDGMNLIVYEIRASNGIVTSHEIVIHVEGVAADWELDYEVSYNDETGMPVGITVRPVDAGGFPLNLNGSEDTDNVKGYNQSKYNFWEYKTYTGNYATEYTYGDPVVDLTYMMIDPVGNVSERTLTVYDTDGVTPLFIDSDEPVYSQFYLCSGENCEAGHLPASVERYNNMDTFHVMIDSTDSWNADGSGINPEDIWLIFDAEYSKLLDGEKDEVGRVIMNVPLAKDENGNLLMNEDGTYAIWEDMENPVNGIYRTQIRENDGNVVAIALWGVWKASDDPEVNVGYPRIGIFSQDKYGNQQGKDWYGQDFSPSVVMNGYSFGVGSLAYNVGHVDPYSGEDVIAEMTILENRPDSEGVIGIYSTVPFQNVSGWGVDGDDMIEVLVDVDADPPFNDYDLMDYVSAGRYYFYPAPMLTQDGTYYFSVTDLFGEVYDQEPGTVEAGDTTLHEQIPVDVNVFGDLGIDVSFSTTDPTNGSVTVFADATGNYELISSITASNGTVGNIDPAYPSAAYITVDENCVITIETEEGSSRNVKVTNIDKVLEPATIIYYDQNYDLLNTEYGASEVTALLVCDEYVITTNGANTYVFPAGSKAGDTYTFEYQDMAGNTGTITATLPVDLTEAELPEVDESAPDLEASLYGYRMGAYRMVTQLRNPDTLEGESELTAEMNADASFKAQKYRVALKAIDESNTKILITAAGAATPTDYTSVETGCTVSGVTMIPGKNAATLEITEHVTFDIHVIDEMNNVASYPGVRIASIDTTAPVLVPVYEYGTDEEGIAVVTATFEPGAADKFEEITPVSADVQSKMVQIGMDVAGNAIYALRYCYTFTGNGSYSFTYQDSIGNIGTATAEVKGLSNEAAVVQSISWYGTAPAGHTGVSPDRSTPVNRDVTAQLKMNKAISAVELFVFAPQMEDQIGEPLPADAPVTLDFTATTINITYSENVDYRIVVRFTASASGRKGTYVLPVVGCIDKSMPQVTLKSQTLAEDKRSMTFVFETSKPTALSQSLTGDNTGAFRTVHSLTVTDHTPMKLYFVDQTGNQVAYEIKEFPGLDTLRLAVSYSRDAAGTGETQDPANDLQLFGGSTFFVRSNKASTVTVNGGAAVTLAANVWTALTTPTEPGFHILKFTDIHTGETLTELVRAVPKDNLAPVMEFASSTVLVWQNESIQNMMNAIRTGVTVTDNMDDAVDYTVTGYPNSTAEPGLFTLRYTAQDSSGNRISAERNLYIVGEGTPILRINGEVGLPYSTVFLSSGEITLEFENSETFADQPVVIKFRKGLYTTGQMKYDATTVENMQFEVTERGHYTIYVRAQDRTEFVTYISLEG